MAKAVDKEQAAKASGPRRLMVLGATLALSTLIVGSLVYGYQNTIKTLNLPDVKLPTLAQSKAGIELFDRDNKFICTVHSNCDKDPVPLEKISLNMRQAIVAAEDHNFYTHHGLDPVGIMRAAVVNYKHGKSEQGASTITQQLARNLFLSKHDKTLLRKAREAVIAIELEQKYSKRKILEAYLNEVYFGGGVHGVERAAEHYFNKHASQLNVNESAFLAGLVRSPSALGADCNRESALARRAMVISQMAKYGYISQARAQELHHAEMTFKSGSHRLQYPQYVSYVMTELDKELDPDLRKDGCKVYTNLDRKAQAVAEKSLTQGISTAPKGIDQGALVTISVKDGAILALVGGTGDYSKNEWNRAVHPHTAGSAFKPFVYLAGLIKGVLAQDSLVDDAPVSIAAAGSAPYSPRNFDGSFKGWMSCRDALAQSRNVCSVRIAQAAGIDGVIETAHAAGIRSQLDSYPSLALGSCAVTPLELANSYATLARYGAYMPASSIRRIETLNGRLVRSYDSSPSQILPSDHVAQLVDVMQDVVRHGTAVQASLPGISVAGKTGTADKGKDLWFVGFTPDTVTAVWGGSDHNHAVAGSHVTGGSVMAGIWKKYMTAFYSIHKPCSIAFAPPSEPLVRTAPKIAMNDVVAAQSIQLVSDPSNQYAEVAKQAVETGIASSANLQLLMAAVRPTETNAAQISQQPSASANLTIAAVNLEAVVHPDNSNPDRLSNAQSSVATVAATGQSM